MRKFVTWLCVLAIVLTIVPSTVQAAGSTREPGGILAFFVGCCWGIREGTEFNDGRNLHWREWVPLAVAIVPYVGGIAMGVFRIWDGVQCAGGMTTREFSEQYGTNWY
ncbi:MAG: hypothetical protein FJ224_11405 [Lentisphaerae bacterium]|nr:hypothetical protein [Lentisphaerota bacterium]